MTEQETSYRLFRLRLTGDLLASEGSLFLQFSGGQEAASFEGVMAEEGRMWWEEVGEKRAESTGKRTRKALRRTLS